MIGGWTAASSSPPPPDCPGRRARRPAHLGGVEPGQHPARSVGRWVPSPKRRRARQLTEQFGCLDAVRAMLSRHRVERAAYRRALRIVDQHHLVICEPADGYRWPPDHHPRKRKPSSNSCTVNLALTPSGRNTRSVTTFRRHLGCVAAGGLCRERLPAAPPSFPPSRRSVTPTARVLGAPGPMRRCRRRRGVGCRCSACRCGRTARRHGSSAGSVVSTSARTPANSTAAHRGWSRAPRRISSSAATLAAVLSNGSASPAAQRHAVSNPSLTAHLASAAVRQDRGEGLPRHRRRQPPRHRRAAVPVRLLPAVPRRRRRPGRLRTDHHQRTLGRRRTGRGEGYDTSGPNTDQGDDPVRGEPSGGHRDRSRPAGPGYGNTLSPNSNRCRSRSPGKKSGWNGSRSPTPTAATRCPGRRSPRKNTRSSCTRNAPS